MAEGQEDAGDRLAQFLDRHKVVLFGIGLGSLVFSWYMTYRMSKDIQELKHEVARLRAKRKKAPWYKAAAVTAGLRKGRAHVLGHRKERRA